MPRASYLGAFKMAVSQWTATVHTGVRQRIELAIDIEQTYFLPCNFQSAARPFCQFADFDRKMPHVLKSKHHKDPAGDQTNTADRGDERKSIHSLDRHEIKTS